MCRILHAFFLRFSRAGLPPPSKDISHIIRAVLVPRASPFLEFQRPADGKQKKREKGLKLANDPLIDEIIQSIVTKEITGIPTIEASTDLDRNAMSNRKLIKLRRVSRVHGISFQWKAEQHMMTYSTPEILI